MGTDASPRVSELLPHETWDALSKTPEAVLIDVRTAAEWGFVGCPDLSELGNAMHCIEWAQYPEMSVNSRFVEAVKEAFGGECPPAAYFICRSGARSLRAAQAVAQALSDEGQKCDCINVAEGFEGDLSEQNHRGGLNGWKARGLPWRQS